MAIPSRFCLKVLMAGIEGIQDWFSWTGEEGEVTIETDRDGRVREVYWMPFDRRRSGLLSLLRSWLGW
jgi:hypothetical protein